MVFTTIVIGIAILCSAYVIKFAKEFLGIGKSDLEIVIEVPMNSSTEDIANQLFSEGIIDNTYCGPNDQFHMPVYATRDTVVNFNDRICQFRIMENQPKINFIEDDLEGEQNRGGFGSTGVE